MHITWWVARNVVVSHGGFLGDVVVSHGWLLGR